MAKRREKQKNFLISYADADRVWAEWIAWQLEDAGYTTVLAAWDYRPGAHITQKLQEALTQTERTLAVFSPSYLRPGRHAREWQTTLHREGDCEQPVLIPVRVRDCQPEGLLAALQYIDLIGLSDHEAKQVLLSGVREHRAKPPGPIRFPIPKSSRTAKPHRFPGSLPAIWNVPHRRNPDFLGRAEQIDTLREGIGEKSSRLIIHAIHGLGGIGKTQLAVEHAYRESAEYDLVWWIRAGELPELIADYQGLAAHLPDLKYNSEDAGALIAAVNHWLAQHERWLLVYEDVAGPDEVKRYLPQSGRGQVLLLSRNPNWSGLARRIGLEELKRPDSISLLCRRTDEWDDVKADLLAEELGDLPLALAQAAAYIEQTGSSLSAYLKLFETERNRLLQLGTLPDNYDYKVGTTWSISFEKLTAQASELLRLCSFLAPESISTQLLVDNRAVLSDELQNPLGDPIELDLMLADLRRFSLIDGSNTQFSIHRLVQDVVRASIDSQSLSNYMAQATEILDRSFPDDCFERTSWPSCAGVMPHALAISQLAENLALRRTHCATLLNKVCLYLRSSGQHQGAGPVYELAVRLLKQESPDSVLLPGILHNFAVHQVDQGNYPEAERLAQEAVALQEKLDPVMAAVQLHNFAVIAHRQARYEEAEVFYRRALRLREELFGKGHIQVASTIDNLGILCMELERFDEAEQLFKEALAIEETVLGPVHREIGVTLNNLANVYSSLGRNSEALDLYKRALTIEEQELGPDHPEVALTLCNLAMHTAEGNNAEAGRELLNRALNIQESALGKEHIDVSKTLVALARVNLKAGHQPESDTEALLNRALGIQRSIAPKHPALSDTLQVLAEFHEKRGQTRLAEQCRAEITVVMSSQGDSPQLATALIDQALMNLERGLLLEAEPLFERAIGIDERFGVVPQVTIDDFKRSLLQIYQALAHDFLQKRQISEAVVRFERAQKLLEALPSSCDEVAGNLNNLAWALCAARQYDRAEPMFRRAIDLLEKDPGSQMSLLAGVLQNYSLLLRTTNRLTESEEINRRIEELQAQLT